MESIYFVASWLCHRECPHCYEPRFHPYHGEERANLVEQSRTHVPRIIENFPARHTYLDPCDGVEKPGRVILAGGEILLDAVREAVLYPAMEQLRAQYAAQGGVRVIIQTTGDILTPKIIAELLQHGAWLISVSGVDSFHAGLESEEARTRLTGKLEAWFREAGLRPDPAWHDAHASGPFYHFFGATPESWIGKLWPRGRAMQNELSQATLADNFCNQWSGGLGFLAHRQRGSEVSVDPEGNVYPCCLKTRFPIGNLLSESLDGILARLQGHPVYEAISMGHPERMGITYGWTVEDFCEKSKVILPSGRVYQNMCTGCDRFHEEKLRP